MTLGRRSAPAMRGTARTLALVLGALLAIGTDEAAAAAPGGLAVTSFGMFAALLAVGVLKGWSATAPVAASSASLAVAVAALAAGWWGMRGPVRLDPRRGALVESPIVPAPDSAPPTIALPAAWDRAGLLDDLRRHYLDLQAAWDGGEGASLDRLTTPELLAELCRERQDGAIAAHAAHGVQRTEVVVLRARLLAFETHAGVHVVSVEFSGLLRESPESGAVPFRELRMLTRPPGTAALWRLARHQALW